MKGLRLLFGVCLGVLAFGRTFAMDSDDAARAAIRGTVTNTGGTGRNTPASSKQTTQTSSRTSNNLTAPRERTGTEINESRTTKNVIQRTAVNRTVPGITNRPMNQNISQRGTTSTATTSRKNTTSRATTSPQSVRNIRTSTTARTARGTAGTRAAVRTTARATVTESGTLNTNYTKCREIYYECMDEFCANKDANLRRCACSARANEFDGMQKQLSDFEDKMLDFNERLLAVNMNAEDVAAMNTSTAGEDAFYGTTDKTKSKKALDDIAKKLNATFGEDADGTTLTPITWSLNIDSAFDTVDSFMGSTATAKSGVALYNAAIPVCREIATEVCTEDELSLATSGYQMQIEQDCTIVKKAYQSKVDSAHAKVFESGALLDMSRLDAYQTRNSDDMLTCKSKMMEMLTDTTVCGKNMEQCIDMTGKYIDPTTGAAFLSPNLADLNNMIARPTTGQTWVGANSNSSFLTYLENKKTYLAVATENCQDIADSVWDAFIEDALAQIKLAQTAKLEEIRQACTTLTTECLTTASESISEFDARALSVFGVAADQTANTICTDVTTACGNLMAGLGDTDGWATGIQAIATTKTYDTIVSSCTQVGKNCIIQSCKSISGNFGLCDDMEFSANRHAILDRTACWPAVRDCVASAGDEAILNIMSSFGKNNISNYDFYSELYGNMTAPTDNICSGLCGNGANAAECATCRITESIWGNCETDPSNLILDENNQAYNHIYVPKDNQETLLSWFAKNTNSMEEYSSTQTKAKSCINTRCISDQYATYPNNARQCVEEQDSGNVTSDGLFCPADLGHTMNIGPTLTNCCFNTPNNFGHNWMGNGICCEGVLDNSGMCLPVSEHRLLATRGNEKIVCVGSNGAFSGGSSTPSGNPNGFPSGDQVICNGTFIKVDGTIYSTPNYDPTLPSNNANSNAKKYNVSQVYYDTDDLHHTTPTQPVPSTSYYIHYEEE